MKLSDFGLTERHCTRDIDQRTTSVISLCMAPEVFTDGAVLKSDVWSLGMSMIEMADGRNPFVRMTSSEFIGEVLNKPPPSFSSSGWSDDLVDFVKKCLVKDVNERASVEELLKVSVVVMGED